MPKSILVFAQCANPNAKGDYMLAVQIVQDLARELVHNNPENFELVLTSTRENMHHYEKLRGTIMDNKITLVGMLQATAIPLEDLVGSERQVVAFIDANRCKVAPDELMLEIIDPESKYVYAGAANKPDFSDLFTQIAIREKVRLNQPKLFNYIPSSQQLFNSCGMSTSSLGLPSIPNKDELAPLTSDQQTLIPKTAYGFAYLNSLGDDQQNLGIIRNYLEITGHHNFVLIGNFSYMDISTFQKEMKYILSKNGSTYIGTIHTYQSIENNVMREMVSNTHGDLVATTGVQSTLEVIADQKLPFYQDLSGNERFVTNYMAAVKSILTRELIEPNYLKLAIEVTELLFADKPLNIANQQKLQSHLAINSLCNRIKNANSQLLANAQGKLAPRLLSFITQSNPDQSKDLQAQCDSARLNLRKTGEAVNPVTDQALRRAATWGKTFELKVLLKSLRSQPALIDAADPQFQRSALLWAVVKTNATCMRLLLKSGANVNHQDADQLSAAHHTVNLKRKDLLEICIKEGANLNLKDKKGWSPLHYAASKNFEEIIACLIKAEADLNIADINGDTPLHLASKGRRKQAIKLLAEAGADLHCRNAEGLSISDDSWTVTFMADNCILPVKPSATVPTMFSEGEPEEDVNDEFFDDLEPVEQRKNCEVKCLIQ